MAIPTRTTTYGDKRRAPRTVLELYGLEPLLLVSKDGRLGICDVPVAKGPKSVNRGKVHVVWAGQQFHGYTSSNREWIEPEKLHYAHVPTQSGLANIINNSISQNLGRPFTQVADAAAAEIMRSIFGGGLEVNRGCKNPKCQCLAP